MAAAKDMDDGEFWLPSDFLTDDFFAGEEKQNETESDEDDPVSGLTHQMKSNSFFNEGNKSSNLKGENPEPSVMATSPQSTLCGIGSWSFSSSGSPDGPSQVSSPPSTHYQQPRDALDLLYAAAGQVERLGIGNETAATRGLLAPPQDHSQHIPAAKNHNTGICMSQDLIQQQLQAARLYQLKRQQLLNQQQQFAAARLRQQQSRAKGSARPLGLPNSSWPPLQKHQQRQPQRHQAPPGSGMTAVFLNDGRRQKNGTGVFLPRRVGATNEPRKKPACSTVLLPARVVQALKLNLEDMGMHPSFPGCYVLDKDAAIARSNSKRNQAEAAAAAAAAAPTASPEIRLPKEWTY